jgi:hypothetical protein
MPTARQGGGQLHELVAFDDRVAADDGMGNTEGDWAEQFQCRAGYTFLRGGEAVLASRLEGVQPIVARIRMTPETLQIKADWQMRDVRTGVAYNIRSIAAIDRKWLDLVVQSGVAT